MADPGDDERTPVAERVHRVHWFAGRVGEVLDDLTGTGAGAGVRVGALTAAETVETLGELSAAINRIEGLRLAVLAHADRLDVGAESGATSTVAWLAHTTATPHPVAHRLVKLARRLESGFEATAPALQAGHLDPAGPPRWSPPSTPCQPWSAPRTGPAPSTTC